MIYFYTFWGRFSSNPFNMLYYWKATKTMHHLVALLLNFDRGMIFMGGVKNGNNH